MSEPIRYDFIYNENYASVEREEHKEGDYVSYEDYARLKAEVERITKAGDTIISILCKYVPRTGARYALMDWKDAKEGKSQS